MFGLLGKKWGFVILASGVILFHKQATGQVRVFILGGQSNMQGHGIVETTENHISKNGGMGTLDYLVENGQHHNIFSNLEEKHYPKAFVQGYYNLNKLFNLLLHFQILITIFFTDHPVCIQQAVV